MTVVTTAARELHGRAVPRADLDLRTADALFTLLSAHFVGVERAVFDADLAEKSSVILLEDERGAIRGFTTLLVYATSAAGRPVTVVYSGDTIVDRAWWGSPALARTWIGVVRRIAQHAAGDVYWLLLTSGFRTYRFLPVFFRDFYPRVDAPTPPGMRALIEALAVERFGSRYDRAAGIVRFDRPYALAPDLVEVPAGRVDDPHVRDFLARNPGYVHGDELLSLTPIHDGNLTPAGRRMAGLGRA